MSRERHPRFELVLALALAVLTFALYARVGAFEHINYDDRAYVTENPYVQRGLDAGSVRWAFSTFAVGNWHPLTWLSLMLDVELFGPDAGPQHLVNAGLHSLNAGLLLVALAALTRCPWRSAFVAALFAWHPQRAESVCWVSERKDLLAGLFFMLALVAYARHARAPSRARMALVALALGLGLLAKPMLVTLPPLLLVLDAWPLGRLRSVGDVKPLLLEKSPLLVLVAAASLVTLRAQGSGGAFLWLEDLPLGARVANAFGALFAYLSSFVVPTGLAFFYPHPAGYGGAHVAWNAGVWLGLVTLLALSLGALATRRAAPAALAGWLWFLGMLVPVSGLLQVGLQSHADRYTYLPGIGLGVAIAFGVARLLPARVAGALGALWLALLVPLTFRQIGTWRDTESVMTQALAVTEQNFIAHTNLGESHDQGGDLERAVEHYRAAAEIKRGIPLVHYQLGRALGRMDRLAEAVREYRIALETPEPPRGVMPEWHAARVALGVTLSRLGEDREAAELLERAVASQSTPARERVAAAQGLGWLFATTPFTDLRDGGRACQLAELSLRSERSPQGLEVLAAGSAARGDWDTAVRSQEEALRLIPPEFRAGPEARLELYRARRPFTKEPERP